MTWNFLFPENQKGRCAKNYLAEIFLQKKKILEKQVLIQGTYFKDIWFWKKIIINRRRYTYKLCVYLSKITQKSLKFYIPKNWQILKCLKKTISSIRNILFPERIYILWKWSVATKAAKSSRQNLMHAAVPYTYKPNLPSLSSTTAS